MTWPTHSVTFTTAGAIPHLLCLTPDGQKFYAPPKTTPTPYSDGSSDKRLPAPVLRDGRQVYAMPGCGEVVG